MSFAVRYSQSARDDLARLYKYLLDRVTTPEDIDLAEQALAAITGAVESLKRSPFIYRKAEDDPFLREHLVPFATNSRMTISEPARDARLCPRLAAAVDLRQALQQHGSSNSGPLLRSGGAGA